MTRAQLANIRREIAAYNFDTSEYLDLDAVALSAARKKPKRAIKRKASARKAVAKKK